MQAVFNYELNALHQESSQENTLLKTHPRGLRDVQVSNTVGDGDLQFQHSAILVPHGVQEQLFPSLCPEHITPTAQQALHVTHHSRQQRLCLLKT